MWIDGFSVYDKNTRIGNRKLWIVLLQRHLLGTKRYVQIPTDRGKSDTKRSMVVGGITIDAANRPDMNMTKTTLKSIVVHRLLFLQILPKR